MRAAPQKWLSSSDWATHSNAPYGLEAADGDKAGEDEEPLDYTPRRFVQRPRILAWHAVLAGFLFVCVGGLWLARWIQHNPKYTKLPPVPRPLLPARLDNFSPHYLNHTKLAVVIERRKQNTLIPVLLNFLTVVESEWPFLAYCGQDNCDYLWNSPVLQPYLTSGKLTVKRLANESAISSGETLSRFLTLPDWWEDLPSQAETLLFFQTDAVLCSNSEFGVNQFLGFEEGGGGYDWVGAPWRWRDYPSRPFGGNGGLSIRRKSVMLDITRKYSHEWTPEIAEDLWFAQKIANSTGRFPSVDTAMMFSYEDPPERVRKSPWIWKPLGLHVGGKGWPACNRHDHASTRRLLDHCPELRMVLPPSCVV